MKNDALDTAFICGMKESEKSKVKPKSERLDEILIEGRDSIKRDDLLKYIRSNIEGPSSRNIESLREIILQIQEIIKIVEDNSYLGNEVKM